MRVMVTIIPAIIAAIFLGPGVGTGFAIVPAALSGSLLWFAARADQRLDRKLNWLVVGASVGLAIEHVYGPSAMMPLREGHDGGLGRGGIAISFAIAGAVAATMFRQTMRALVGFQPLDDEP